MLFWVPVGVLAVTALGLLLAPLAALTCVLVARSRGIEESYAGAGAKHSALLVLPFLYLLARLVFGRSRFPKAIIMVAYVLVYMVWLAMVSLHAVNLLHHVVDLLVTHEYSTGPTVIGATVLATVLPVISYTMLRSILNLRTVLSAEAETSAGAVEPSDDVYLFPFMALITWAVVSLPVTFIVGTLGYIGT